jgi:chemotaxis protein methyltransferase CheR
MAGRGAKLASPELERELAAALTLIHTSLHVDLSGFLHGALLTGLLARKNSVGLTPPDSYLALLERDPRERHALIDAIAINTSSFFRDPLCFETIGDLVLHDLITDRERSGVSTLRIWSAGCSTGEEAYSIALLAREALSRRGLSEWRCLVFATDIDERALAVARRARYPRSQLSNVRLGMLDAGFERDGEHFEVRPEVREMVHFSRADLADSLRPAPADSIFGAFDLVLCRNVLIYFSAELRQSVLGRLGGTLRRNGFLVLGEAEALDPETAEHFGVVAARSRIFKKV